MQAAESQTAITPENRLFSSGDVALATFLGSIMAGSIVLALNFLQIGRARAAHVSMIAGIVSLGALLVAAVLLEDSIPTPVFTAVNLGLTFGMKSLADTLQGSAMSAHRQAGGRVGAGWKAAGIGLISLIAIAVALFGMMLRLGAEPDLGDSVEVDKVTVHYKDGVTEAEARKVGEQFRDLGLVDHEIDIQLLRRDGKPHILFIVEEGTGGADSMSELGRLIANHVFGGGPAVVDLADQNLDVHTSVEVNAPPGAGPGGPGSPTSR